MSGSEYPEINIQVIVWSYYQEQIDIVRSVIQSHQRSTKIPGRCMNLDGTKDVVVNYWRRLTIGGSLRGSFKFIVARSSVVLQRRRKDSWFKWTKAAVNTSTTLILETER
jgi:hypothetical protein